MSVKRGLGLGLGFFLIVMGIKKLLGDVLVFELIELYTGLGFAEPAGRYITASLEIVAGLLLVFGKHFEGGALASVILVLALVFHISVIGINAPISTAEDSPRSPKLFILALTGFITALYITIRDYLDKYPEFMSLNVE